MKLLSFALTLFISACFVLSMSSCETSRLAYGKRDYFRQTPKAVEQTQVQEKESIRETAVASIEPNSPQPEENLAQKVADRVVKLQAIQAKKEAAVAAEESLSRAERRELRKEAKAEKKALKKELKALVKDYKKAPEKYEEQQRVSGNTRTGIILGAVGLVLVLIGGGVLYIIGAILLVIGLVMILLEVL